MEKGREGEERERGGGREGEGGREEGREGGREGGRKGGREEGREGGSEEGREGECGYLLYDIHPLLDHTLIQQDKLWMNYQSHH